MLTIQKISFILFLFSLVFNAYVIGEWPCRSDTSIPIVTESGNQWNIRLASDGQQGAIMVWQDRRAGTMDKLFVQRVNSFGNTLWTDGGLQLASSAAFQYYPQILSDGVGGAFIVWQDNRSGADYDIYIQRVSSAGISLWTPNGVAVCTATGHQYNPQLVSDGAGGVIVTWQDRRAGNYDIYAQRLTSVGLVLWTANGLSVSSASGDQVDPRITSDGSGGAILTWTDFRSGSGFSDVYAQRISSSGTGSWTANGVAVCVATNTQWNAQIISSGAGGTIVTWQDRRAGTYENIFAQRLNALGQAQWTANGVAVAASSGVQYAHQMVSDQNSGAIIVWQDNRRGNDYDIYAQRINQLGQPLWSSSGESVCNVTGHQYNPQLVAQSPNVIFTWQDKRNSDFDVYAQSFDFNGSPKWSINGISISNASQDQFLPQMTSDQVNGAIIAWADFRRGVGTTDIFSHRIGANGKFAGGCYRTFTQESFGLKALKFSTRFSGIISMPNEGNVRDSIFGRGFFAAGITLGIDRRDSARTYGWIYISKSLYVRRALPHNGTARAFDTRNGRNFVRMLRNPSLRSYNNRLAGELLTLRLNIAASDAGITERNLGDLVFKDTSDITNPINNRTLRQVVLRVDSLLTLWKWYGGINYERLANWLHAINTAFAGPFDTISTRPLSIPSTRPLFSIPYLIPSALPPAIIPATYPQLVEEPLPEKLLLGQNYPNPFNPWTTIEFTLPEPALVTLKVYNMLGQVVSTLIDQVALEEGYQAVEFSAVGGSASGGDATELSSGVYFYQVIAKPFSNSGTLRSQVRKMILIK
ncbi:MAG: T9SS type A sorting domain-containing protein [Ignavibacteriae bacterium]|nr:T9SS type A sorting domain-containing protein [Ignavibacteriota bacterium]